MRVAIFTEDLLTLSTFPAYARMLLLQMVGTGITGLEGDILADTTSVVNNLKNIESLFSLFHWTIFLRARFSILFSEMEKYTVFYLG